MEIIDLPWTAGSISLDICYQILMRDGDGSIQGFQEVCIDVKAGLTLHGQHQISPCFVKEILVFLNFMLSFATLLMSPVELVSFTWKRGACCQPYSQGDLACHRVITHLSIWGYGGMNVIYKVYFHVDNFITC